MSLTDSCGIPAGLLRLLRCLKEDITEPLSWNLQKSKEGCFSLKFWTHSFRAENGTKNNTQLRERTGRPRAATPVTEGCKSTIKGVCPPSQDRSRLSGTSPRILDPQKSVGSRKRKSPSRRKRNRQRQAAWRLKKRVSFIKLQAAAKRQVETSTTWKPHGHDTGSVIVDTDTSSPPEPASSGPVLTQALEKPEGVSQEPVATVEQLPETNQLQESSSTVGTVATAEQSPETNQLQESSSAVGTGTSTPDGPIVSHLDSARSCADTPPPTSKAPDHCAACGGTEGRLKACSACKAVQYCSLVCQKSDWHLHHKYNCAKLKL